LLSNTRMTYDLVGIPAEEFKDSERTTEQIFGEAARRCYRIPPAETALFFARPARVGSHSRIHCAPVPRQEALDVNAKLRSELVASALGSCGNYPLADRKQAEGQLLMVGHFPGTLRETKFLKPIDGIILGVMASRWAVMK